MSDLVDEVIALRRDNDRLLRERDEALEALRIGRMLVTFGFEKGDVTAREFKERADAILAKHGGRDA